MRSFYTYLFCFFAFSLLNAQTNNKGHFSYKRALISDILKEWTDSLGIQFSYDADLLNRYRTSDYFNGLSTEEKLVKLLRKTPFDFDLISETSIILRKRSAKEHKQYEQSICGRIFDQENGQTLTSVSIIMPHTSLGTLTDINGQFQWNYSWVPDDSIQISYIGFKTIKLGVSDFFKGGCLDIYLPASKNELETIVVTAEQYRFGPHLTGPCTPPPYNRNINEQELLGGQAIRDIGYLIQLLPGVSSTDESASKWNIRGGSEGQNLVLFDNIPLYHTGHFFGKTSAINANIVESASVQKDGIDAAYGGFSAGLVTIDSKQTIPDSSSFIIESSLLSANANIRLPLMNKKAALFVSYRRSLTDFYQSYPFQKLFDQTFQNSSITFDQEYIEDRGLDSLATTESSFRFYDMNVKLLWHPSKKDRFSVSFITVKDEMSYNYQDGYYTERENLAATNNGLNVQWYHKWKSNFSSRANFSWSAYHNDFLFIDAIKRDSAAEIIDNFNEIKDVSFKLLNRFFKNNHQIDFGYQLNKTQTNVLTFKQNPYVEDELFRDDTTGVNHAFFISYKFRTKRIGIHLGSRFSFNNLINKPFFEPRVRLNFYFKKDLYLSFSAGIYKQAINQIVETNPLNVEDHLWILSRSSDEEDAVFDQIKNEEYSINIAKHTHRWRFYLGVYKRAFKGITSKSLKFDSKGFPFYTGGLNAKGVEASISHSNTFIYSKIAYTFSEALYSFQYPDYLVAASYNRLHSMNTQQAFQYKNWELSFLFRLSSGRPFTPFKALGEDSSDPNGSSFWIEYEDYNKSRLPTYQRLDISLSKKIELKNTKIRFSLGIQNVLNHDNYLQRSYRVKYFIDPLMTPEVILHNRLGLPFMPNVGIMAIF